MLVWHLARVRTQDLPISILIIGIIAGQRLKSQGQDLRMGQVGFRKVIGTGTGTPVEALQS